MTEENMNKVLWIAIFIAIMLGVKLYVADPSYNKIKAQADNITGITYTSPET